jgi:cyclophilin family peptidyl-prolyl cis-trans isomerase
MATPWLDDKHTIFGNVIEGKMLLMPLRKRCLESVEIRAGDEAKTECN